MKTNRQRFMLAIAAAAVVASIAACSSGNSAEQQALTPGTGAAEPSGQHASGPSASPPDEEKPAVEEAKGEALFADIPAYDGNPEMKLTIGGQETTARFESMAPFHPFGLYVPSALERYDFEDGVDFGYNDKRDSITIGPFSQFSVEEANLTRTNETLAPFAEYVGSQPEGGDNPAIVTDFFAFEHEGTRYGIRFRYGKEEAAAAVPLFLETVRQLRLVNVGEGSN